jgi:hypothetical protein
VKAAIDDFSRAFREDDSDIEGKGVAVYVRDQTTSLYHPVHFGRTWDVKPGQSWVTVDQCGVACVLDEASTSELDPSELAAKAYGLMAVAADHARGLGIYEEDLPVLRAGESKEVSLRWYSSLTASSDVRTPEDQIDRAKSWIRENRWNAPEICLGIGLLLERTKQTEKALKYYRAARVISSNMKTMRYMNWHTPRYEGLARCHVAAGRDKQALWCYLQAGSGSEECSRFAKSAGVDLERVAIGQLIPCAGGSQWNVLRPVEAIGFLGELGGHESLARLLTYLTTVWSEDDWVRGQVLQAMGHIVGRSRSDQDENCKAAKRAMMDALAREHARYPLEGACSAVGSAGLRESESLLRKLLEHNSPAVRSAAASALRKLGYSVSRDTPSPVSQDGPRLLLEEQ